jgi:hypothetical protein
MTSQAHARTYAARSVSEKDSILSARAARSPVAASSATAATKRSAENVATFYRTGDDKPTVALIGAIPGGRTTIAP